MLPSKDFTKQVWKLSAMLHETLLCTMIEFSYLQNKSIVKKEQSLYVPFTGIFETNKSLII
jgi:hypothetical protein